MKPYFEQGGIAIYHASYLDVAMHVDLSEVGCVIADPPYGVTALAWDKWPDGWPGKLVGHVPETAALWCFGSMRMFFDRLGDFGDWRYGQDIVWEKQNGSGFDVERFRRVHEHALMFYRGAWGDVFKAPQRTGGHEIRGAMGSRQKPKHTGEIGSKGYTYTTDRMMTTVLRVASVHGDHDVVNETQKPIGIVEPLVRYSMAPGKILFEPFMGGGTALVVAKSIGARAIGCDIREDQCEAAAGRIVQTMRLG